ncbi:MAG: SIS domain-containing protein [Candidatus Omnitrophica bacterium]|nr:SIS domain-containing protein [Candidatus Omnitrophota bacterium]
MKDSDLLKKYIKEYLNVVDNREETEKLLLVKSAFLKARQKRKKVIFAGNGASAAIASHASLDFTKQSGIRSVCFNEAAMITAFGNDHGYENWIAKALEFYADKGDVVVLVSSSGRSPNIIKAAKDAVEKGYTLVTFSGFDKNNPLRSIGKINLWADSRSYNIVESAHMFWLMCVSDLIKS